jgi:hypothetical protein
MTPPGVGKYIMNQVRIDGVFRRRDTDSANVLGKVNFTFILPAGGTKVVRGYKKKGEGGGYGEADVCEISVPMDVKVLCSVKDARIIKSDKGTFVMCDVKVSREVRDEVVALALPQLQPSVAPQNASRPAAGGSGARPAPAAAVRVA